MPPVNDAITSALQAWTQSQQQAAVEALRSHADAGERSAIVLISWFLSQMGQPGWEEGIAYAHKAAQLGVPQASSYFFGAVLSDASFRHEAPQLADDALRGGWPIDPVPNALSAFQQGDPATAVRLVEVAALPRPYPQAWKELIETGQADLTALRNSAGDVGVLRDAATEAINESRTSVESRTQSLLELVERLTTGQSMSYFEEEATQYGGEAKWLWVSGVTVLVLSVLAAALPLGIYYFDKLKKRTPWLEGNHVLAAHTTFIVALGALAGVLFARARGRDRARQRARDLSVALRTMFAYSESIADPGERQIFIRESGRTVLEAFLRQDAGADADRSLLAAVRGH